MIAEKTTILEAISLVLAPTWNIPFCDNDFYMKNVEEPIQIEISVKIPETFNKTFSENVNTYLVDINGIKTLMDSRKIYYNQNKLSLHDVNGIPFRVKGKGTRRLLSTALQFANKEDGSITLIDELEQGLEPYRVKTFVRELKNELVNKHQIFLTTHSSSIVIEIDAENIVVIRNDSGELNTLNVSSNLQRIIRKFPDALFSKKLLACEGSTEYDICNELDEILFQQ